jgi:ABC-type lipoprotein release transport system permease subunit
MNITRIAGRNVIRYWHRTLVTTLAMAFAGFIMIVFACLLAGMIQASERNAVILDVGDFQIHETGYRDDPDLYKRISDEQVLLSRLRQAGFYASPRLYGAALAASGTTSSGVQLRGIDVDLEATVTEIHKHVMNGAWLDKNDPNGVVIGRKLARTLGVGIGDEVVIIGQASDGSMANEIYRVRGILKSVSAEIDQGGFFMHAENYRQLMTVYEGVHEIVIMRPDRLMDLEQATSKVKSLAPGYEVLNWRSLHPVIARIIDIMDNQIFFMMLITYIAVAMVVLNAMLMSVFERIHEFGIMKAIGVTPWQLVFLIYMETLIQVAAASVLALLTAWPVADHMQDHGLDLSQFTSGTSIAGVAMDPVWHAYVTLDALAMPVIFLFIISMLAVIYPAVKAAVIEPVKAIYYR